MLDIQENYNLKNHNTFGLNSVARYFLKANNISELSEAMAFSKTKNFPVLILGGGSNILPRPSLEMVVVQPAMDGLEVIDENEKHITVEVASGMEWDRFVELCVNNGWQGLENLSYIPGNVGASPIQNIGAYGIEVKDFIENVKGIFINNGQTFTKTALECAFGYRSSVFKTKLKHQTVITHVQFKLNKLPQYNISYSPLQETFANRSDYTAKDIREAVVQIRKQKLPEPKEIGNAGSFFKNPVISKTHFRFLRDSYPDIPHYQTETGIKIPAAWLIEKAGWKGFRDGETGCHPNQPLCIVNYGNATFDDIHIFSQKIIKDIRLVFNINLEMEVNIL